MKKIKLLLLSDLHSNKLVLKNLNNYLTKNKFAALICAGDIISTPDPNKDDFLNSFVYLVCQQHKIPLFAIHGNNEDEANIKFLFSKNVSIHNKAKKLANFTFFGIGGSGDEISRDRFARLPLEKTIFVTHYPPRRLKKSDRQKIRRSPAIHICGHLHGKGRTWKIGKTHVIKLPDAERGGAAILELPDKKVSFIDIK